MNAHGVGIASVNPAHVDATRGHAAGYGTRRLLMRFAMIR
jgi:hypothetical protein